MDKEKLQEQLTKLFLHKFKSLANYNAVYDTYTVTALDLSGAFNGYFKQDLADLLEESLATGSKN